MPRRPRRRIHGARALAARRVSRRAFQGTDFNEIENDLNNFKKDLYSSSKSLENKVDKLSTSIYALSNNVG